MLLAAAALIKDSRRLDFEIDGARGRRAALQALHRRAACIGAGRRSRTVDRRGARCGRLDDRRTGGAGAGRRQRLHDRAGLLHADGERADIKTIGPERPDRRRAHRHRRYQGRDGTPPRRRSDPRRLRDRESRHLVERRDQAIDWLSAERSVTHTEARVDRYVAALDRNDDDPLEFSVAYIDAGRVAGHLRPAGGDGRGHVPSRSQRAHGHRHGRGRRPDAVGSACRGTSLSGYSYRRARLEPSSVRSIVEGAATELVFGVDRFTAMVALLEQIAGGRPSARIPSHRPSAGPPSPFRGGMEPSIGGQETSAGRALD